MLLVSYRRINMKVAPLIWSIDDLNKSKDRINPKPQYQRTSVWSVSKKKLLIDSILRGYDIPKFYLNETPNDPMFDFEVTDGQQRMRSIWEFMSTVDTETYKLGEAEIDGVQTKGLTFKD